MDPILTAHLLPRVEALLIELLRSLTPEEWEAQTIAPQWKVRDVAAHLLDTELRKLSIVRDGYAAETPAGQSIVEFVNRLNREGVTVYRRLSPPVLITMMEWASGEYASFHQSLDPLAAATFSVSWAGEDASLNWFDTAREFTERWHHQQQIRLATARPGIMTPELYYPVLDCFMRALPHCYRTIAGDDGDLLEFDIEGDCGGSWFLYRDRERWRLIDGPAGTLRSLTTIPQEIAWRIFTKGIDRESAVAATTIEGDREAGSAILSMIAIVG